MTCAFETMVPLRLDDLYPETMRHLLNPRAREHGNASCGLNFAKGAAAHGARPKYPAAGSPIGAGGRDRLRR